MDNDDQLFDERGAAAILFGSGEADKHVRTMQYWRRTGDGPTYMKIGRCVRYAASDLKAFKASRRRLSTSERAPSGDQRAA